MKLKNKETKEKENNLKNQIQIERSAKNELDRLLRLKPKEYKNLSKKEKEDANFAYIHEKAKSEVMKEEINKLAGMTAVEYLENLNAETMEKLIGLCLNKEILEFIDEDTYMRLKNMKNNKALYNI